MRDGPRPSLISVRGWNRKSSQLGCFRMGGRRGGDNISSRLGCFILGGGRRGSDSRSSGNRGRDLT